MVGLLEIEHLAQPLWRRRSVFGPTRLSESRCGTVHYGYRYRLKVVGPKGRVEGVAFHPVSLTVKATVPPWRRQMFARAIKLGQTASRTNYFANAAERKRPNTFRVG
jgi:hypothetical protein